MDPETNMLLQALLDLLQSYEQDSVTKSLAIITHPHDDIHDGNKYKSTDVVTGLGASITKRYLIVTPNTSKRIHMLFDISSTPGSTITIFEAPTITSNGTVMAAVNQNRNSGNTATLQLFHDPVISANGNQLETQEIGSGTSSGQFGGSTSEDRNENEWVLKQNTAYYIQIVTLSNSTDVTTIFHWYEI